MRSLDTARKIARHAAGNALRASEHLPKQVRRNVEALQFMMALGAQNGLGSLLGMYKYKNDFAKFNKALLFHRFATALLLGHRIGLFDHLLERLDDTEGVAVALKIHPRAALQLLRILEAEGYVERRGQSWTLSEFAREFLARNSPSSVSSMLELMSAQASAFGQLPRSFKNGKVPKELDIFSDHSNYEAFLQAVNAYLDLAGREFLLKYPLPEIRSIIAGSMGVSFVSLLLHQFPEAKVTFGCLEHLVERIPELRDTYGVNPAQVTGMHSHSGEPGDDKWGNEAYDMVFLTKKMILDPDNEIGKKFATKAFQVLNPGGVAVFWETIHPDDAPTPLAQAMEAVMDLGASPIGPVLTHDGLSSMLSEIGYCNIEFVPCLQRSTTFIVGHKA